MKRREFLALLGGTSLVGPRAALAQAPGRIYHLATIRPGAALTEDRSTRKNPAQVACTARLCAWSKPDV